MPNLRNQLKLGAKICGAVMKGPAATTKQTNKTVSGFLNSVQRANARSTLAAAADEFGGRLAIAGKKTSSQVRRAIGSFYDRFSMDSTRDSGGTRRKLRFDGKPLSKLATTPAKQIGGVAQSVLSHASALVPSTPTPRKSASKRPVVAKTRASSGPAAATGAGQLVVEKRAPQPVRFSAAPPAALADQAGPPTVTLTGEEAGGLYILPNGLMSPDLKALVNKGILPPAVDLGAPRDAASQTVAKEGSYFDYLNGLDR